MPQHETKRTTGRIRALLIGLNLLLLSALVSLAQDTGQICLQAYADDNENGIRDEIEAPISRGRGRQFAE